MYTYVHVVVTHLIKRHTFNLTNTYRSREVAAHGEGPVLLFPPVRQSMSAARTAPKYRAFIPRCRMLRQIRNPVRPPSPRKSCSAKAGISSSRRRDVARRRAPLCAWQSKRPKNENPSGDRSSFPPPAAPGDVLFFTNSRRIKLYRCGDPNG